MVAQCSICGHRAFLKFFNSKGFARFCRLQAINACGRAGKWKAALALLEELHSQRLADATSAARNNSPQFPQFLSVDLSYPCIVKLGR